MKPFCHGLAAVLHLVAVTGQLVLVAKVFTALVTVQNGWRWILAQCFQERRMG